MHVSASLGMSPHPVHSSVAMVMVCYIICIVCEGLKGSFA